MYTPNRTSRRPRPPGNTAHRPQPSTDHSHTMSILKPGPLASLVSSTSLGSFPESPSLRRDQKRQNVRHSINPQDLSNVSLDLDVSGSTSKRPSSVQMQSSESVPSVASLRSLGEVAPSPPPPYGGSIPDSLRSPSFSDAPTPPTQDSGLPSQEPSHVQDLEDVEEDLRAQRASDAAKVLGLNIDFETSSQASPKSGHSSDSMSEGSMRAKMKEMKRQMRRREQELVMAAQFAEEALQTQEQLLAYLPAHVVASISSGALDAQHHLRAPTFSPLPSSHSLSRGMSSSSSRSDVRLSGTPVRSPSRPFRTVRHNDPNLPFPLHQQRASRPRVEQHFVSHLPSRSTIPSLQQEVADERISVLEQALLEARKSEDSQRKVAVRLRKEMERLQRLAERAEEEVEAREVLAQSQSQVRTPRNNPRDPQVWRRATPDKVPRESTPHDQPAYGWGSTAFPSFPTESSFRTQINVTSHDTDDEPDLGDGTDRLPRMSVGSRGMSPSSIRSFSESSSRGHVVNSMADRSSSRLTPTSRPHTMSRLSSVAPESRKLRKKVSQSNFLEPTASLSRSSTAVYSERASGESSSSQSGKTARMSAPPSTRSSSFRRSPWPSPDRSPVDLEEAYDEYPFPTLHSTLRIETTPRPSLSPAFASLSQRMESMRAFVSSALDPNSTFSRARGRTLGSELGDESTSWDTSMKAIEQTLMRVTMPDGSDTEAEEDLSRLSEEMLGQESDEAEVSGDQSFVSDGEGQTPAPLPPHISAALNSLALALAPATVSPLDTKLSDVERSTLMDKLSKSLPRIKWALDIVSPLAGKGIPLPDATLPASTRTEESSDPWNDKAPTAGPSRKAEYRLSLPLPPRPTLDRNAPSDGSIALAHRRRSSQQVPTLRDLQRRHTGLVVQSEFGTVEMQTIPGRLVHDFICLMAIMMEFVECSVVIVFRVVIDVRYNRKTSIGMDKRSRSHRYYL